MRQVNPIGATGAAKRLGACAMRVEDPTMCVSLVNPAFRQVRPGPPRFNILAGGPV